jgi:hypothetical protein
VPLDVVSGSILLQPRINGTPATFILDTGAQRSVITEAAVRRLGVARDAWIGTTMRGVGGIESRPNADPSSFTLGGVQLVRPTLSHDTSLTVGTLPDDHLGRGVVDGVLGRDFLSPFDLDLDMAQRALTLYRVRGCAGRFLPWKGAYSRIPVAMPVNAGIFLRVAVDGVPLTALFDTGASASLLALPGIRRLALEDRQLASDPAGLMAGFGPHLRQERRHTFRSLVVGDQTTTDPVIWVAPIRLAPIVDMLLGADWLTGRHVWLSFATRQLFVAAPGGGS